MPRGLSSTILPASTVAAACGAALAEIDAERKAVEKTVVDDFINGKGWLMRRSLTYDHALRILPVELKTIFEEFRRHDIDVLRALGALARAALDADPSFTVEITADDFRLLRTHYGKGSREQTKSISAGHSRAGQPSHSGRLGEAGLR